MCFEHSGSWAASCFTHVISCECFYRCLYVKFPYFCFLFTHFLAILDPLKCLNFRNRVRRQLVQRSSVRKFKSRWIPADPQSAEMIGGRIIQWLSSFKVGFLAKKQWNLNTSFLNMGETHLWWLFVRQNHIIRPLDSQNFTRCVKIWVCPYQ